MDPQVTWNEMLDAIAESDFEHAGTQAQCLLNWLDRKGFAPNATTRTLPLQWNVMLCRHVCQIVLLFEEAALEPL